METNQKVINLHCFGTQLRKLRIMKGFSAAEVANLAEITPSYLSSIESNHKIPEMRALIKLCKVFDIEMHELFLVNFLEKEKGVAETDWRNPYPQIRAAIEIIGSKIYPKNKNPLFKDEDFDQI